jgi:hypothetical protein
MAIILDVLTDCMLWSHHEPDFNCPGSRTYRMGDEIARSCLALRPMVEPLSEAEEPLGGAAREFLETVDFAASA